MNLTETVNLAREGDGDAVTLLYDEYKRQIYFLALKLMGNTKDASNILQYTFFQAFHKLGALKNPENFEIWLYIIASGRCRMLLREKYPLRFAPENDKPKAPHAKFDVRNSPVPSPEIAEDAAGRAAVSQMIDKMTDLSRMSLLMYFYCGISVSQIAKVINSDEQHIRQYLAAGEAQLQTEIDATAVKLASLGSYTGIAEIGTILRRCALDCVIAPELDEAVTSTSITLAVSAVNAIPEMENTRGNQPEANQTPSDEDAAYSRQRRAALRNLISIAVVIALAAAIIIISVNIIRNAANDGNIVKPEDTTVGDSATAEPVTDNNDQTETETAPIETETDTQPVETEADTEPATETEDVTTAVPADENPGISMTAEEASKLFICAVANNAVVISQYNGDAREVDIPGSIDGLPVTAIGPNAFKGNTTVSSVNIPDSVAVIGAGAFQECSALTSVTLSSSLTEIGYYAFLKCSALTSVTIPSSVTKIGYSAFQSTAWLSAQTSEFVIVGDGVLIRCNSTATSVVIPDTVKYVSNAFYYNQYTQSVVIPSTVTAVDTYAFCSCPKLTSIAFPSSVASIGTDAIFSCSALTSVTAPSGSFAESWLKTAGFTSLYSAS